MTTKTRISEAGKQAMAEAGVCGGCVNFRAEMGTRHMCAGCLSRVRAAKAELSAKVDEKRDEEFLVETNSGTFGAEEAVRMCGTSDPRVAERNVYENAGGTRRWSGCDAERMPGRVRHLNGRALREARAELAGLRKKLAALPSL